MDLEPRIQPMEDAAPASPTKTELAELRRDFAILRADVADIRADIHKAIAENARWTHLATLGMFLAFILGAAALVFTIYNASRQAPVREVAIAAPVAPPAPATPPFIINIPSQPTPFPPAAQAPAPASN